MTASNSPERQCKDEMLMDSDRAVLSVSTCAKAIICGEHAVLYGSPAVSIPLSAQRMKLTGRVCRPGEEEQILFGRKAVSPNVCGLIRDAFNLLSLPEGRLRLSGSSDIPIGSGLGSSAALSIATLKLAASVNGRELHPDQLAEMGRNLEARFHGSSSGLDTATVAWENPILFHMGQAPVLLRSACGISGGSVLKFCLINSGVSSSTCAMVQQAKPWFTSPLQGQKRLAAFSGLAAGAAAAMESDDALSLAEIMNQTHCLLSESGVSAQILESMRERILSTGALASKITGAGGGGCLLTLLHPELWQDQLRKIQLLFGNSRVYLA
ncbi:MAG: mevalonate kinase [Deltaproteobacteria bacterium]|nr:mevalonate kinase [Deltaproteobacteria bacterium]